MAGFALGVVSFQILPWPLAGWLAVALAPLLVLLLARGRIRQLGLLALGLAWAATAAAWALECRLPAPLDGKSQVLEAVVVGLPEAGAVRQRFLVRPIRISAYPPNRPLPRRIRLSWYGRAPPVHPGEHWRWRVKLKQPSGLHNPGGFDYERWLFRQRIDAVGYVQDTAQAQRLGVEWSMDAVRADIARRISTVLAKQRAAGVLTALVTGDRRRIEADTWRTLNSAGISHLIAISGLHIGLVAGLVYGLAGWLWRRLPRFPLWLPTPVAQAAAGTLAAAGYATLAGFTLPTRRALIMLAVLASARLARRRIGRAQAWWAAMAAVLVLDPFAPLGPGFWLSFTAVAVILLVVKRRADRGWLQELVMLQFALALGLLPVLAVWFQRSSLLAPLVNLLAIPVASALLVPGALIGTAALFALPMVGAWLLQSLGWGVGIALLGLEWLQHIAHPLVTLPLPAPWAIALAAVGAGLLLLPAGFPGRVVALPLLVPLLAGTRMGPGSGEAWITVLDVGQGSSVVVRTARHVLVYDTAPIWGRGGSAMAISLLPFLRSRSIEQVDRVILSHVHGDHTGGLNMLLSKLAVDDVLISEPLIAAPPEARPCHRGQKWRWDGVRFRVLSPGRPAMNGHAVSCVLQVRSEGATLLLPGDLRRSGEHRLLEQVGNLSAEVLLVPHHGSPTSSSIEFVRRVHPELVLLSVGRHNPYAQPAAQVIDRYRAIGARILRTDHDGAIQIVLEADGYRVRSLMRWDRQRYYHTQP